MVKKKLTPASIVSQKKWASLPVTKKRNIRKLLPDSDKDGVPNKYDCRPQNKRRQEGFLPYDSSRMRSQSEYMPDKHLGSGGYGEIYSLKGNLNMVIKVPKRYVNCDKSLYDTCEKSRRIAKIEEGIEDLMYEYNIYKNYGLEHEMLFIPTKLIDLPPNDIGISAIGLLRPYVTIIDAKMTLTDKQLGILRNQLISISKKGLVVADGMQIGIDRSGRILLYDLDGIEKTTPSSAFKSNSDAWSYYLERTNYVRKEPHATNQQLLAKYGDIRM